MFPRLQLLIFDSLALLRFFDFSSFILKILGFIYLELVDVDELSFEILNQQLNRPGPIPPAISIRMRRNTHNPRTAETRKSFILELF